MRYNEIATIQTEGEDGSMYQVGQQVVYGVHGVCRIIDIEIKTADRQKIPYFVLEPLNQPGARYYIPKEKPAALAKLNPLLTRQQAEELLATCNASCTEWIPEENQRKLRYRDLLSGSDRRALLVMVHTLHQHRIRQAELGKKFHLCDEAFLRDAQKLLCAEFSLVLDMSEDAVAEYLKNQFVD